MASHVFKYTIDDFVSEVPLATDQLSRFDTELQERWDKAEEEGYFRYQLGTLATRVIDGPHGFVAQLNVKRATERRKAQEIKSTKQPFKPQDFNFNKIKPQEVIMDLYPEEGCLTTPTQNGSPHLTNGDHIEESNHISETGGGKIKVIINVSPLERYNVLLVPGPEQCQPQIATLEMIQIGVETLLLSSNRALRVGYNSLCAYASVNHLHMHAYCVEHQLPLEYWPTKEVVPRRCHETIGWPAQAIMLQLTKDNYREVVRDLYLLTKLLQDKDIAHNMFFTRGLTLGPNPKNDEKTIRLILWPRRSSFGVKANDAFNGACCELAGHLPIKLEDRYKHLTDEECCSRLELDSLSPDEYSNLKKDIKQLFL